jgi:hypothetical protein
MRPEPEPVADATPTAGKDELVEQLQKVLEALDLDEPSRSSKELSAIAAPPADADTSSGSEATEEEFEGEVRLSCCGDASEPVLASNAWV